MPHEHSLTYLEVNNVSTWFPIQHSPAELFSADITGQDISIMKCCISKRIPEFTNSSL